MQQNGPRKSRRVTPMMMPHPCPSASRLLRTFFKSHQFFMMEKWLVSDEFQVKVESLKFKQFYLTKFYLSTLTEKSAETGHFSIMKKIVRFKVSPQLPGAGRARAWHHHGSQTSTFPGSILLCIQLCHTKHFCHQCISKGNI